jgi:hypothetical protein
MIRYQQLQQRAAQLGFGQMIKYKTVPHYKEFDFDVAPNLKVVRKDLPLEYDDKGNVKKYTKEELKKLRDPDMPEYFTAKIEDLQAGQKVKLYLGKPKAAKKKATKSSTDDKATDEEPKKGDAEPKKAGTEVKSFTDDTKSTGGKGEKRKDDEVERPYVRRILILADPDPNDPALKQKKRRKKDE